jgi:hypothetical protein
MQPIYEPTNDEEKKAIFTSMISDKDPVFMRRALHMILTWDREEAAKNITHTWCTRQDFTH